MPGIVKLYIVWMGMIIKEEVFAFSNLRSIIDDGISLS
jgi:hypothetical protein